MSASQMRLLTLFMERPGELITREQIAERLWTNTGTIDVATGINTAINRLRRQLQESPGAPTCIETVIGLGYRFISNLEEVEPAEPHADPVPGAYPSPPAGVAAPDTLETAQEHPGAVEPEASAAPHPLPGSRVPPQIPPREHVAPAPPWRWIATVALCGLVLLSALGWYRIQSRESAPAAKASASDGPASHLEPPLIRVTADENVGKLTAAAVAPSGGSVAYADRFGVSVHWFASGTERLLGVRPSFTVDRLAWLPDDGGLLMSGTDEILHRQQVWLVPLQGAYLRLLLEDADRATMSPDGSQIAFTRGKDRELWLADAEAQHSRPLRSADAGESFGLLLWSPAGNRLMVTLGKKNPESRTGTKAVPGLIEAPGQDVYECIDPGSGQVLDREEGFSAESGYLLPDGHLYFAANVTPGPTTGVSNLMFVPTDLGNGRFLGPPQRVRDFRARRAASLTASSSGARVAAVLDRAETDVFVADLRQPGPELTDVDQLTRGTSQNYPHSWTADSNGIFLENDSLSQIGSPTKWSIFNQPIDGSKPALIASLPESAAMAQLSPDGQWILFLQFVGHPQHPSGIFRMPAGGGRIEQVPTQGNIEEFHCSASTTGRCVLREAVGNEALVYYAFDPVQGMGQELGRTPWQPNRLGDWGLSADGTKVASAGHDTLHPSIGLIRLGTGPTQVQEIAVPGHGTTLGATWAINGQSLFVECRTETGFELISLDMAGHVKPLGDSPSLIWAVPSRDGKKVAFPSLTMTSSVWASPQAP